MQAIVTKFIPATDTKPSRYKAACERGGITVSVDHGLSADENHIAARKALVAKFVAEDAKKYGTQAGHGWDRPMVCGGLPDGTVAHVFVR